MQASVNDAKSFGSTTRARQISITPNISAKLTCQPPAVDFDSNLEFPTHDQRASQDFLAPAPVSSPLDIADSERFTQEGQNFFMNLFSQYMPPGRSPGRMHDTRMPFRAPNVPNFLSHYNEEHHTPSLRPRNYLQVPGFPRLPTSFGAPILNHLDTPKRPEDFYGSSYDPWHDDSRTATDIPLPVLPFRMNNFQQQRAWSVDPFVNVDAQPAFRDYMEPDYSFQEARSREDHQYNNICRPAESQPLKEFLPVCNAYNEPTRENTRMAKKEKTDVANVATEESEAVNGQPQEETKQLDEDEYEQLKNIVNPMERSELITMLKELIEKFDGVRQHIYKAAEESISCRRIFVRNVAFATSDEQFLEYWRNFGKVFDCQVLRDRHGLSRGYGFVTFAKGEDARKAMQSLHTIEDRRLFVHYATEAQREEDTRPSTRKIFVRNLPDGTQPEDLRESFSKFGVVSEATLSPRSRVRGGRFGFVTFDQTEAAHQAVKLSGAFKVQGCSVSISLAYDRRPPNYRSSYTRGGANLPVGGGAFIGGINPVTGLVPYVDPFGNTWAVDPNSIGYGNGSTHFDPPPPQYSPEDRNTETPDPLNLPESELEDPTNSDSRKVSEEDKKSNKSEGKNWSKREAADPPRQASSSSQPKSLHGRDDIEFPNLSQAANRKAKAPGGPANRGNVTGARRGRKASFKQ